jgi:hypothetical protein
MIEMAWPFEIVQTQDRVDFLYQWNHMTRGVPVLDKQDTFAGPFYYGQSVGQWQGNVFVVDVVGVNADTFLDPSGLPHTDNMHLTETFSLTGSGATLEVLLHIDDPATFSAAWDAKLNFVKQAAGSIEEDDCVTRLNLQKRYPVLPTELYPR